MTAPRVGAALVTLVALAVALGGLYVFLVPVDSAMFADETSVEWEAFAGEQPSVAAFLRSESQLVGLSNIALGLVALALVWTALRTGDRLTLRLTWILTAYVVAVVVLAAGSTPDIAAFYAVLAGAAAVGLLLLERAHPSRT